MYLRALLFVVFVSTTQHAHADNFSAEIYGGNVLEDSGFFFNRRDFPVDRGSAAGIAAHYQLSDSWEVGVDLMKTSRNYTGFSSLLESKSLMLTTRYNIFFMDTLKGYVSAGLGAVEVKYDGPFVTSNVEFGGQLSIGIAYGVGPFDLFAEMKYQDLFNDYSTHRLDVSLPPFPVEYNSKNILFGLRYNF